ncbi:hypothetical protein E2C01_072677 [Portunus trituberculatus]|uniref:Uncharacterized protein n=1 Tax=Portunus trituberculatus TaxID=210409 RepID=A0A5B7I7T4_PORTR|nr:hypothetical protein [Portunus trituberculatus]
MQERRRTSHVLAEWILRWFAFGVTAAQWNDDCTAPGDYSYRVSVRPYGRVLQGGGTRQQARRKG